MQIGFIGLGHMGQPMAKNLMKAGHSLTVFDVNQEAVQPLVALGAKAAASIAALAKTTDVIFTSLQTSQQVNDVTTGSDGIFAHAKRSTLYVDLSSIDITVTRDIHRAATTAGLLMIDAPVSGGVAGAEAATLTFMVGGELTAFQKAEPILHHMGRKVIHAGSAGLGQAAKICNNLLLGISMLGVCEAFNLAERIGLNAKKFFEISSNSSGQCWSMTSYCPVPGILENVPSNHNYQPGFMAKMMLKDLRLAQLAAETVDAAIPLGSVTTELYDLFVEQGFGDMDFSGIIKFLQR